MATLYAYGNTFHGRKLFKLKGFKWEPDDKEWVHQNLSKKEIYETIAQCVGLGIKFRAISKNGRPIQLKDAASKDKRQGRAEPDYNNTSKEDFDGSKFYSPGHSATNAPKPYGRKIEEPLGSREDFKDDRASNFSRSRKNDITD